MDQSTAPLLDALADYRDKNRYGFTPPGHRQGRGTDERVLAVLGREPFLDDVLASGGLDDRRTSNGYLKRAEDLMADAVGAKIAWFSTCGSSLSVRAAMMAVAGGDGSLLVGRDSHKSIVAGPTWAMDAGADVCVVSAHKMGAGFEQGSVFHVQGDLIDQDRLSGCADLLMTTSPNVLLYAAMDGCRRFVDENNPGARLNWRLVGSAAEWFRHHPVTDGFERVRQHPVGRAHHLR